MLDHFFKSRSQKNSTALVFTDGAIRPELGKSGLGAVVRDHQGGICHWWACCAGPLTCNEAEFEAAIMALDRLRRVHRGPVLICSDSQVMVNQMEGHAAVHSPALRQAGQRLRELVNQFPAVRFQHIPRERNRLADALANEVVDMHGGTYDRI